jgi:hypothetical protein
MSANVLNPVTPNGGTMTAVAAAQTGAPLGASGAIGDYVSHVLVLPANTSPGSVTLIDGATSYELFAGGASSVADTATFDIPVRVCSRTGAWTITTGADVSVIVVGIFS